MKKFFIYCIIIIVALFLGFTTYYLVANKEQIVLACDESVALKLNLGETVALSSIITHTTPHDGTTIAVESSNTNVICYDANTKIFTANSVGTSTITITPSNIRFGPFIINARVGNGLSAEYPIYISNESELRSIGTTASAWTISMCYELTADIYLTNGAFTPIALNSEYSGTFNGSNFTIYDLIISSDITNAGLFSAISQNGVVKNVKFSNANINGSFLYAGVVAGVNKGVISLCEIKSSTLTNNSSSGFTGLIAGANDISIIGTASGRSARIGMCGVENCSLSAVNYVGGIVGRNNASIVENCYSVLANFTSNSASTKFGGIVGQNLVYNGSFNKNSYILNCHAGVSALTNSGTTSGISAYDNDTSSTLKNTYTRNYFSINTTNFISSQTSIATANIEKKTIENMKSVSTYQTWDFVNIWKMGESFAVINFEKTYISSVNEAIITDPDNNTGGEVVSADTIYEIIKEIHNNPNSSKIYVITSSYNVNLASSPWTSENLFPLGTRENPFTCQFYTAQGVTLTFSNLSVQNADYSSFFGYVGSGAIIKGIDFNSANITGNGTSAGIIAGEVCLGATIQNCDIYNSTLCGNGNLGLVAGINYGTLSNNSTNTNSQIIASSGNSNAGGICGLNKGSIISSTSNCDISASGSVNGNLGGIVGQNDGNISSSAQTSGEFAISSGTTIYMGGLAGTNNGSISNSTAENNTISLSTSNTTAFAGGIAGSNTSKGTITNCDSENNLITSYYAGGLSALNYGFINFCTAGGEHTKGSVSGVFVGGLASINQVNGKIYNCLVATNLIGLSDNGKTCGFAYKLEKDSIIQNCFGYSSITGKGGLKIDSDTPYYNWFAQTIWQNSPWGYQMGVVTNSLIVNANYSLINEFFDRALLTNYNIIISDTNAKGANNFVEFIDKNFSEGIWNFTIGYYPTLK